MAMHLFYKPPTASSWQSSQQKIYLHVCTMLGPDGQAHWVLCTHNARR